MQSLAGGGLSEQARQRAEELANTSDLRVTAPRAEAAPAGRLRPDVGDACAAGAVPRASTTRQTG